MNHITVVDARMGRGKSSAAINYMNANKSSKRFMYITPYLKEVERICEECNFVQPESEELSKSYMLKRLLRQGQNIAASHALFYIMDEEALTIISDKKYTLIVDEEIDSLKKLNATAFDVKDILNTWADEDENGFLKWRDPEYSGLFAKYKEYADMGQLLHRDSALMTLVNPSLFRAFDEVFMLTYMFNGQYQKAYLDYYGFDYSIIGVTTRNDKYYFSDGPDCPPPLDLKSLVTLVDSDKMNHVGDGRYSLSRSWYSRRTKDDADIVHLRKNMHNFFKNVTKSSAEDRIWTCYKEDIGKLKGDGNRYIKSFLQIGARATNEYANKHNVAYMVNRFADPNMTKFFGKKGACIDQDDFGLSNMVQFIWRSAIRAGEPINLYIPSKHMRDMLCDWMDRVSEGGVA